MILSRISTDLQIDLAYLRLLSESTDTEYRLISIPKRRGGKRAVFIPSARLKLIQRHLVEVYIDRLPIHPAAMAYIKGKNILRNAETHAASKYLLCMDYKNFFGSITHDDVVSFMTRGVAQAYRMSVDDATTFANLVTRCGRLVIGAPSSPALSNAICLKLDRQIADAAKELDCRYTRYADDLAFSSDKSDALVEMERQVIGISRRLDVPANLEIHELKTRRSSRWSHTNRRTVTGLVLTQDGGVSVGRKLKRKIRSILYDYYHASLDDRRGLAGQVAFVEQIEPGFIESLRIKYGDSFVDSRLQNSRMLSSQ